MKISTSKFCFPLHGLSRTCAAVAKWNVSGNFPLLAEEFFQSYGRGSSGNSYPLRKGV